MLLFSALITTKIQSTKSAASILIAEFQDMKFIKYYSKEAVDEYLNNARNKINNLEEKRKYLNPTCAPRTIIYQIVYTEVNQHTSNLFARFTTTGQDTSSHLETTTSSLKPTRLYNVTLREATKWESDK